MYIFCKVKICVFFRISLILLFLNIMNCFIKKKVVEIFYIVIFYLNIVKDCYVNDKILIFILLELNWKVFKCDWMVGLL